VNRTLKGYAWTALFWLIVTAATGIAIAASVYLMAKVTAPPPGPTMDSCTVGVDEDQCS
jgi:hypothetical protein